MTKPLKDAHILILYLHRFNWIYLYWISTRLRLSNNHHSNWVILCIMKSIDNIYLTIIFILLNADICDRTFIQTKLFFKVNFWPAYSSITILVPLLCKIYVIKIIYAYFSCETKGFIINFKQWYISNITIITFVLINVILIHFYLLIKRRYLARISQFPNFYKAVRTCGIL